MAVGVGVDVGVAWDVAGGGLRFKSRCCGVRDFEL